MKGRIINNISKKYEVNINENIYECEARGKFKQEQISPVVGDYVEVGNINEESKYGIIEKIFDRENYLKRPKISNLDQIILVISSKMPKPDLLMLDKQLIYIEYLNIKPLIVVNKIDLDDEKEANEVKKIYEKIGYTVIPTNAKEGKGIETLKKVLENKTSAFSGNSGVGKSTLLNKIFNNILTTEGEISSKNKKGKNTTTSIKIYELNSSTYIADTPGFSSFEINEINSKELINYFIEFKKYVSNCEFIGCNHIKEGNCGIKRAVEEGKISKLRYENFIKIYNESKEKEEHKW